MSVGPPPLGAYLRPGPDQTRLLGRMVHGHARAKHGAELGQLSASRYEALVTGHLETARLGFEVTGRDERPRYLLADPEANRVAWITPHAEQRSTFFAPRQGVAGYVGYQRLTKPAERWQRVDLQAASDRAGGRERNTDRSARARATQRPSTATTSRQRTRRIISAARPTRPSGPAR